MATKTYSNFEELIEDKQLSSDDFPYAEHGPHKKRLASTMLNHTVFAVMVYIAAKILRPIVVNQLPEPTGVRAEWYNFADNFALIIGGHFDYTGLVIGLFNAIETFFYYATIGGCFFTAVFWAIYLVNVVKRQRSFEREVIANDAEANRIHKNLMDTMSIPEQIKRKQEVINKAEQSTNSNSDNVFSGLFTSKNRANISDVNELAALKAFRNVRINVNTRQDVSSDDIYKTYTVTFEAPPVTEASDKLEKMIDGVDATLSRIVGNGVNFGGKLQSSSRTFWTLSASTVVEDKYPVVEEVAVKEAVVYETAFDLSLLIDNRPKIEKKKAGALKWANDQASTIDAFLTTGDAQVTRTDVQVNASNAIYIYDQPRSFDLKKLDEYKEKFDTNFKQKGSDVEVSSGRVVIAIPLPKQYNLPIDVGSMFRETFFSPET